MFVELLTLLTAAFCLTCVSAHLELVHVVFRHGQRTPADTYPKDPHVNATFAPVGWGQLTNKGKYDQFKQGKWLRDRYDAFLGSVYTSDVMIAHSTDVDRTRMSCQLELAGMWPPAESQKWHPRLNWQPIPVHYQPISRDNLLLVRVPCNRYYEELELAMKSPEVTTILEKHGAQALYEQLSRHTGLPFKTPDDVQSLYSTLKAEADFHLALPSWTREFYPDKLVPLTAFSFVLNAYTTELQKLKGGPLLKKILADSTAKAGGTLQPAGRKMFMYAGHDSTISNLLRALQVWDEQVPGYGIMVLVELHRLSDQPNDFGVKVFLRNSTTHDPYLLTLPDCESTCPLDKFVSLTKRVVPADLSRECVSTDPNYSPDSTPAP